MNCEFWVEQLVNFVGILLGVLGGGLASLWLYKKQKKDDELDKLEELSIFLRSQSENIYQFTKGFESLLYGTNLLSTGATRDSVARACKDFLGELEHVYVPPEWVSKKKLLFVMVNNISSFTDNLDNLNSFIGRAKSDLSMLNKEISNIKTKLNI